MTTKLNYLNVVFMLLFATSGSSIAADNGAADKAVTSKVAYQQAQEILNASQSPMEKSVLIFSAAPRGGLEESQKKYAPLADYLSKVIGKKIVYQYPGTWGVYQGSMQKGMYDLVYDGPHLNGWRVAKLQHNVLAKIPNELVFVILVRKDNVRINKVEQLVGRTVCAHAPPNLGTLMLLNQFDNPARQPVIIPVDGWDNIYKGLVANKCAAALVPKNIWDKNKEGDSTRLVYKTSPMPNQAFSAGPRISKEDQAKIAEALISPEAAPYTEAIRSEYGAASLVRATREEYVTLGELLKNEWGYN